MKKKVLAMILTAVCTMGLMAGCGNSSAGDTNTQKNASSVPCLAPIPPCHCLLRCPASILKNWQIQLLCC